MSSESIADTIKAADDLGEQSLTFEEFAALMSDLRPFAVAAQRRLEARALAVGEVNLAGERARVEAVERRLLLAERVDEWMLYDQDSPTAAGGRGLGRGLIYDANGDLVVSVVQEGLLRQLR